MKNKKIIRRITEREYGEYLSALKEEAPTYSYSDATEANLCRHERDDRPDRPEDK